MTISELKLLKESEDKIEFKEGSQQYPYNGKRRSILGYTVALANEKGGYLAFGLKDAYPHEVVGSKVFEGIEGVLEQRIYNDTKIRVQTEVLFEGSKRVLVIKVPSRPIGKALHFEDVPLMRVGEELQRMSDEMYLSIIQEQEPDFSAKICEGITVADLDSDAINKMKESYSRKQNNPGFLQLSNEQVLTDLKLLVDGNKINYAGLILLGKKETIERKLPQSKTIWEFRGSEGQIHHDARREIQEPLFIAIDNIWDLINQPVLNRKHPIQTGAYIFDLFDFNERVIREAVLNAEAHRDYTITSEVVIKQFPNKITINNPGGFPKGVTIENILTVSSTPRSRLMTEILEKTGLVERSGQGVDKIFSITLSEGKAEPDYTESDMHQVSLTLRTEIIDKAFHTFVREYQDGDKEPKLGVEQIITLCKIRNGIFQNLKADVVSQLEKQGLIKRASSHTNKYILSPEYHQLVEESSKIGKRYLVKEIESIVFALQNTTPKIGELENSLSSSLNRNQIKYLVTKLAADNIIVSTGSASGTRYQLAEKYKDLRGHLLLNQIVTELREIYK
ncbi:ATP-dependent DNA helicase RecG [Pedobacter westerhofensis]|uniref:ATP-dependent DNA helicase RecG n=1 Tax=Pedobacter westerhofensis TaxID=425512 RepID=A0A521DHH6_9SPHI|nr:ATP-binding protein [Pedobacter westerhofensis]SMO71167.1 ATP-dependent DNA helicase RecG [Pedobacter westerhofensis]